LIVISAGRLVAAMEFKSQVGPSFGNNFNNRSEEALGSASCIWTAYREGRFGKGAPAPFIGYLFLLEDCEPVHRPVRNAEPHFAVDPVFVGTSYSERYELLCRRLVLASNTRPTRVRQPAEDLSFQRFAAALRGHVTTFLGSTHT
jgi:hypothetical protein